MKRKLLSMLLTLCMVVTLMPGTAFATDTSSGETGDEGIMTTAVVNEDAWTKPTEMPDGKFSGGSGTENDPFKISTTQDLADLAYIVDNSADDEQHNNSTDQYYVLTNDINLSPSLSVDDDGNVTGTGNNWESIGEMTMEEYIIQDVHPNGFQGTLDGAGHTISGLKGYPLFEAIYNGTVKNLAIANSYICKDYNAVLTYLLYGATVENCAIESDVFLQVNGAYAGGICVIDYQGYIKNCSNAGKINGNHDSHYIGGICGYVSSRHEGGDNPLDCGIMTLITNCYNSGMIQDGENIGGIAGIAERTVVSNCHTLTGIPVRVTDVGPKTEGASMKHYPAEYTQGYAEGCSTVTEEQVRSGEVAYMLNNGNEGVWKQTISDSASVPSPVKGEVLHLVDAYDCPNATTKSSQWYSNSQSDTNVHVPYHRGDENGMCSYCNDGFEEAENDNGTYKVSNAGQLCWISELVNSGKTDCSIELTADIVMPQGISWTPIGTVEHPFSKNFDGKNFKISGLDGMLFGSTQNADIHDFALEDGSFGGGSAASDTGSVIGNMQGGKLSHISSSNDFSGSQTGCLGGLAGRAGGTIQNCFYNGSLSGASATSGGLVGTAESGLVITGGYVSLTGDEGEVSGAVVGSGSATITNFYYNNETGDGAVVSSEVGKPAEAFTSGEVTWYLNGEVNADSDSRIWGQAVSVEDADETPCFGGTMVYQVNLYATCNKADEPTKVYRNTQADIVNDTGHDYQNGICTLCYSNQKPGLAADGYYEVENFGELRWAANQVNELPDSNISIRLTSDIELYTALSDGTTFSEWEPIGKGTDSASQFQGTFDGNYHTITKLNITKINDYNGLFGVIAKGAAVKNLTISEPNIAVPSGNGTPYKSTGGICGSSYGTITHCLVLGGTVKSQSYVASELAPSNVGGVCGLNSGSISDCGSSAVVAGLKSGVGGISGYSQGDIENCWFTGKISETKDCGAISGIGDGGVENCYAQTDSCRYEGGGTFLSAEAFTNGQAAWCLNTKGLNSGDAGYEHSGIWSQGAATPTFADSENAAVYRARFLINSSVYGEKYVNAGGTLTPFAGTVSTWKPEVSSVMPAQDMDYSFGAVLVGNGLTVAATPAYGDSWGEILSYVPADNSMKVSGVPLSGSFRLMLKAEGDDNYTAMDSDALPLPGSYDYSFEFVCSGEYTGITIVLKSGTVEVDKREIAINWGTSTLQYSARDYTFQPVAANILEDDEVSLLSSSAAGKEIGEYTATVTGIEGDSKELYKLPAETTHTYKIVKRDSYISGLTSPTGHSSTYNFGETISIEFSTAGVLLPSELSLTDFGDSGKLALFLGETQLTDWIDTAIGADKDIVLTYNTLTGLVPEGEQTLTVKFDGSTHLNPCTDDYTVTINPATPTLSWGDNETQTVIYTGSEAVITAPAVTLLNNETYTGSIQYAYKDIGGLTRGLFTDYTDGLPVDVGTYSIKAHIGTADYYTAADSGEMTLTIEQSTPAVAFNNYAPSRAYDGTALAYPVAEELNITGAAYGNVIFTWYKDSVADENMLSANPVNAGSYVLVAGIAETGNTKAASVTSDIITISQVDLTITASEQRITYGNEIDKTTAQVKVSGNGLVNGDTLTGITLEASTADVTVDGTITPSAAVISGGADNYNITYNTGKLTIEQAIPLYTIPVGLTASYGQTLADVELPTAANGAWSWKDASNTSVGNASDEGNTFKAVFTPLDEKNYAVVNDIDVVINVAKANSDIGNVTFSGTLYDSTAVSAVTLTRSDNKITGTLALDGVDKLTVGTQSYNWKFTPTDADAENYNIRTGSIELTVLEDTLSKIEVTGDPDKKTYTYGESFAPAGLTVTATYLSGNTKDVTSDVVCGALAADNTSVELSYTNGNVTKNCTYTGITVNKADVVISGITAKTGLVYDKSAITDVHAGTAVVMMGSKVVTSECGTLMCKYSDTSNGTYTETAPSLAGKHYFKLFVADENANYTGSSDAVEYTINKKALTAQWTETSQVYNGNNLSPTVKLSGILENDTVSGTASAVNAAGAAAVQVLNAGTYTFETKLSGTDAGNYYITNPKTSFTVQKAPVTFAVTGDTVPYKEGTAQKAGVSAAWADKTVFNSSKYNVTYRNGSETAVNPTAVGNYDIYAEITDNNYRHAGDAVVMTKKIGVLTIYEQEPTKYAMTFNVNEGTSQVDPFDAAKAGTIRILPKAPTAPADRKFGGWNYSGRIYQAGDSFVQPESAVEFTAVWNPLYSVSGTVKQNESAVGGAAVTLVNGSQTIAATTSDDKGTYQFTGIAPGTYNLRAEYNGSSVTKAVIVSNASVANFELVIPEKKISFVAEVAVGTPAVAVDKLNNAVQLGTQADETLTAAEKEAVVNGGAIELKVNVGITDENANSSVVENIKKIAETAKADIGLLLDINLTKTVTNADGTTVTDSNSQPVQNKVVTETPELLEFTVSLTGDLQNAQYYKVLRYHDSAADKSTNNNVDTLTSSRNADGEYISVNDAKTELTLHVKKFSIYAVATTTENPVPETDPTPGTPSTGGGGGGGAVVTYSNSVNASANGSVTMDKASPAKGATVTITVKADNGYALDTLKAADASGNELALTKVNETAYTFVQPDSKVTVSALFKKTDVTDKPSGADTLTFTDVSANHWSYDAVQYAYQNNLFKGISDTEFGPDVAMTRGMLVTVLYRMEGEAAENANAGTASASADFTDVKAGSYYETAVNWAFANGIVTGKTEKTFAPDTEITREQMSAILYRYAQYKNIEITGEDDEITGFADISDIAAYAQEAMRWSVSNGLIKGADGKVDPQGSATRAQVAAILMRYCEDVAK